MNKRLLILIGFMLLLFPLKGQAQDDLFDTKASAEHIEKGITELKAKNIDAAISEFDEAASIDPGAEAYYYLGYAYYLKGKKEDGESRKLSLENFDRAYEIDPSFTPSRYRVAQEAQMQEEQQPMEDQGEVQQPDMTEQPGAEPQEQMEPSSPSDEQQPGEPGIAPQDNPGYPEEEPQQQPPAEEAPPADQQQ